MDCERVVVAEILRPRGNRGELLVRSQTDVPGRLESLRAVSVRLPDGTDESVEVVDAWQHKEFWVLSLAGVNSISEAEKFRGSEMWVPFSERARLPEGEVFESDLIGCTVIDEANGKPLGVVEWLEKYGGPPLLGLIFEGREVQIPFVPAICRLDLPARQIRATLPDGLLEH